ncbi:hypothetical protein M413DRAFT_441642 [Hebeloma cylindrosporum]|uniref:Uncharacterized protein n=1 Tax=Hebeloma cylindrosporum TaxID=76867 RepID=A0A0C3CCP8_HEBCY|nr:hypothetical protein M413DRAFT_441642 [Hebeloma cylindrosporum h7]
MSAQQYAYVEQDPSGPPSGNELPTYDDLANQNGPNSRFGRWRGWIEKRAAERYADITPEERNRRRERGWGNPSQEDMDVSSANVFPSIVNHPPTPIHPHGPGVPLHIQTSGLMQNGSPPHSMDDTSTLAAPIPFVSQVIEPTHLKINHFGSRFLPHTTSQIRSVLPLLGNTMLLVGHDNGLSVLDMFPQEWTEGGEIVTKGPDEAQCREIWRGETVYQMTILESEDHGSGTPQGVVLAIVGPAHDSPTTSKDPEQLRAARMYSLSSLISLARWTIAQKGTTKPLDLHRMSSWQTPSTPSKRHRTQGSIARGLKSLIESPNHAPPEPSSSYHAFLSSPPTTGSSLKSPHPSEFGGPPARKNSDESGWDMVEDLPLRWATDFVPLAVPGSRLVGASVVGFATWSDESRKGKMGGQLLAIATKSNVLLYETPKGERAYRFVKEFYTPVAPRNLTFIQQSVADKIRNPLDESPRRFHSHRRSDSGSTLKGVTPGASSSIPLSDGTHLSLFIVFDKKAGWIRLADSVVGEVELGEDGGPQPPGLLYSRDTFSSTMSTASVRQRSRLSFDIRESIAKWIVPVRCELPVPGHDGLTQPVHILTRGKRTHVVPCPLPSQTSASPPLHAVFWKSHPTFVSPRVILSEQQPLLQLVAFGENGIEIQEMGVSFMSIKGKGRAFPDELIRAEEDLGGDAGFLSPGGNWDRLEQVLSWQQGPLPSAASVFSSDSSMDGADILERLKKEEGIYGWCRKGLQDWRIFWVGGSPGVNGSGGENSGDIYS